MKTNLLAAAAMLFDAVVCGIIACFMYRKKKAKLALCHRTWGDVIAVAEHQGRQGGRIKNPVIRFKDMNGQDVEFESNYGSSSWKVKTGDRLEVFFNPNKPREAEVVGFMPQWFLTLIFAIVSVCSLVGAPLVYLFLKR